MNFCALFSAFLITFLTLASATTPTLRELRQLESRVAAGQRRDACLSERSAAVSSLTDQLKEARNCRFAGLPFATYASLRDKCQKRSELRSAMQTCTSKCVLQRRKLAAAVSACKRIGWDATGSRSKCAKIRPLWERLAAARARTCSDLGLPSTMSLIAAAREAAEQRRVALGLPMPAYELTVLEPLGGTPDSTAIILHGFGQKVEELVPAIRQAQLKLFPNTRFILPQANEIFSDATGARTNAWWNIRNRMSRVPDRDDVLAAARNINAIARIQRKVHGIKPERVLIFGVSQGGALALTVYLRFEVGALVVQSGFLVLQDSYPEELDERSKDAPLLVVHGSADESVPVEEGRKVRDMLREYGRTVKYIEYEGDDHTLTMSLPEAIEEVSRFFAGVLVNAL